MPPIYFQVLMDFFESVLQSATLQAFAVYLKILVLFPGYY